MPSEAYEVAELSLVNSLLYSSLAPHDDPVQAEDVNHRGHSKLREPPTRLTTLLSQVAHKPTSFLAMLEECSLLELLQLVKDTSAGTFIGDQIVASNVKLESRFRIFDLSRFSPSTGDVAPIVNMGDLSSFLKNAQHLDATNYLKSLFEHQECAEMRSVGSRISDSFISPLESSFLTYNVWGLPKFFGCGSTNPERFGQIGRELRFLRSDIVALQEMWHQESDVLIAESNYSFRAVTGNSKLHYGGSGLVTLSKFPIISEEFHPFSKTAGVERLVNKGALFTRVQHPSGSLIDIYNVHLISEPEKISRLFLSKKRADELRLTQLRELATWITSRQEPNIPIIVLGDFNLDELSSAYSVMTGIVGSDLFRQRLSFNLDQDSSRRGYTFDPENNKFSKSPSGSKERIDYVLLRNASSRQALISAKRIFAENPLSDHYGVYVKLKLYNTRQGMELL
jgi:endonuclease/exonuclease/phosphatase family metal-dependent hydrolase